MAAAVNHDLEQFSACHRRRRASQGIARIFGQDRHVGGEMKAESFMRRFCPVLSEAADQAFTPSEIVGVLASGPPDCGCSQLT